MIDLLRVFSFVLQLSNTPSHTSVLDFTPLTTTSLDNVAGTQRFQLHKTLLLTPVSGWRWVYLKPIDECDLATLDQALVIKIPDDDLSAEPLEMFQSKQGADTENLKRTG